MRIIDERLKTGYLRELDRSLSRSNHADEYFQYLIDLASRYGKGPINGRSSIEGVVRDIMDIVAPTDDPHVIVRSLSGGSRLQTGKLLRLWVDIENTRVIEESPTYPTMAMRIVAEAGLTRVFSGYVPFKVMRHAVLRILERSKVLNPTVSAGVHAMTAAAMSLAPASIRIPTMLLAIVTSRYPFFGVRVADGILLCEHLEETTRYDCEELVVSADGVRRLDRRPIFGEAEPGIARVILGKTWIGPNEITSAQAAIMDRVDAIFAGKPGVAERFRDADLFRDPNWVDKGPFTQPHDLGPITRVVAELAALMGSQEYRSAFPRPKERR